MPRPAVFRNLGTKLLALAIAILVWFVFSAQQRERISERSYRIPLSIANVPPGTLIASPLPPTIEVRLRGPFTALRQLDPVKLEAVVDLTGAPRGEKIFRLAPEDINVPQAVEVIAISPSEIRVALDATEEKTLPIVARVTGKPAEGFEVGRSGRRAARGAPARPRVGGRAHDFRRDGPDLAREPVGDLLRAGHGHRRRAGRPRARRAGRDRHGAPAPGPRAGAHADAGPPGRPEVKLFGTDGLRAKAGVFPLDPASVRLLGEEVGRRAGAGCGIVLGGDTRESTPRILAALGAGRLRRRLRRGARGGRPDARDRGARAGAFRGRGDIGLRFSQSVRRQRHQDLRVGREEVAGRGRGEAGRNAARFASSGRGDRGTGGPAEPRDSQAAVDPRLAETYLERLAAHVPARLEGLSIVMDAGNGAAYRVGPEALRRAGATVTAICDRPDGRNINAGCGALHPEGMAAKTRAEGAAMGVAFDGDADRAIFADETGRILDGDDVLWIVARDWKRRAS